MVEPFLRDLVGELSNKTDLRILDIRDVTRGSFRGSDQIQVRAALCFLVRWSFTSRCTSPFFSTCRLILQMNLSDFDPVAPTLAELVLDFGSLKTDDVPHFPNLEWLSCGPDYIRLFNPRKEAVGKLPNQYFTLPPPTSKSGTVNAPLFPKMRSICLNNPSHVDFGLLAYHAPRLDFVRFSRSVEQLLTDFQFEKEPGLEQLVKLELLETFVIDVPDGTRKNFTEELIGRCEEMEAAVANWSESTCELHWEVGKSYSGTFSREYEVTERTDSEGEDSEGEGSKGEDANDDSDD